MSNPNDFPRKKLISNYTSDSPQIITGMYAHESRMCAEKEKTVTYSNQ